MFVGIVHFPLFGLILPVTLLATPLYLAALWADRTEKVLIPQERSLYWLLAFTPLLIFGYFGWGNLLVLLILKLFHYFGP
jgi:hypothetical protein